MRPLLVGESNPYSDNPAHALMPSPAGSAGARLADHLGLPPHVYLAMFDRVNLLPSRARWSAGWARQCAAGVRAVYHDAKVVLLLGARVAAAFGLEDLRVWHSRVVRGVRYYRLPHPSGRSRVWNDRRSRVAARGLLRRVLRQWPKDDADRYLFESVVHSHYCGLGGKA